MRAKIKELFRQELSNGWVRLTRLGREYSASRWDRETEEITEVSGDKAACESAAAEWVRADVLEI